MRPPLRIAAAALLLPAASLAFDPGGLSPFGPAKWLAVPTLVLAAFALTAWRRPIRVEGRSAIAGVAFLGLVAAATVAGVDHRYAWIGTPERHFGALTWLLCAAAFLIGQAIDDEGDARTVVGAATVTTGLIGAWAVAEAFGWHAVRLDTTSNRLVGPFGSAAYLGAATALLVPLSLGVALDPGWTRWPRIGAATAAAAGTVALVGSGTRGAWIGLAVGAGFLLVRHRAWIAGRRRIATAAAGAIAVAAVIGLAVATGVGGRAGAAFDPESGGGRGRLDEWRVALRVVAHHPLLGAGPEGYRIDFSQGVDAAYEAKHGRSPLPDRAHDSLLDVATTTGLPGLAAYLAVLATAGLLVIRALRSDRGWLIGVAAGLAAYATQQLFLFPVAELEPAFWLLTGLAVAQVTAPGEQRVLRCPRPAALLAGALALAALVAGGLDVAADRQAKAALAALDRGEIGQARTQARRAVDLRPDALRYHLVEARADEAGGDLTGLGRALDDLAGAARWSPRDPIVAGERARLLLERASASGEPEDADTARDVLERLTKADPHNAELQLRLGVAAALTGNDAEAERAWLAAERLDPHSPAALVNLATAYARAGRWTEAESAARRALARDPGNERASAILRQASAPRPGHGT